MHDEIEQELDEGMSIGGFGGVRLSFEVSQNAATGGWVANVTLIKGNQREYLQGQRHHPTKELAKQEVVDHVMVLIDQRRRTGQPLVLPPQPLGI